MTDRISTVRLRAEVTDFKRQFDEAAKSVNRTAASIDKDGQKIQTASGRMIRSAEVQRESWNQAGTALTAFGVAGVAALGLSAKAAIDWESAWTGVLKTVEATPDELSAIEDGLRSMALEIPKTAGELAGIAEIAGQLGVSSDGILTFTRTVADLSETTNLTAEEAATNLARIANIMGTPISEVANMGATIVDLGNNAATTEAEIVALATRLAAAGKQAGLAEADTFAYASALTSVGVEAEAGGTALSKVFTSIGDAVRDGGSNLETFAGVADMTVSQFSELFEDDAASAIAAFVEGMGRMSASGESTTAVFENLELTDERLKRSILSLGSAQGLLADQLELANSAWESNEALISEAEKRYDTTEAKIQIAKNAMNEAAIVIGEQLLPALAGLAEGVAGVAEWFAALPAPVQGAVTGLGGIASVAALAAGGFLLLFPRVLETVRGLRDVGAVSPGATTALGKTAAAVGKLSLAFASLAVASEVGQAVRSAGLDMEVGASESAAALLDLAEGANIAETSLQGLFSGGFGFSEFMTGADVDNIERAYSVLNDTGVADQIDNVVSSIFTLGQSTSTSRLQSEELFQTIDQGLSSLVASGATEQASAALAALASEAGVTVEELKKSLPGYRDALSEVDTEQQLVDASAQDTADALALMSDAQEEAAQAAQEWRDAVGAANASFIDVQGAYDDVIAKNQELAQATADATEDASDAWTDYYDGVTVGKDDYIASLEEQVEAQIAWQDNILAVAERVRDQLPENMRSAGEEMVNELLNLGPEGAAQVELLKDLTDTEFAQVVELYGAKGAEATAAFIAEVEGIVPPAIPVDADITPAERKLADLRETLTNAGYTGPIAYGDIGGAFAGGGPIHGPGTSTSDSIPIWASDNEYMQSAAAHQFWGTNTMDALNNRDVSGLMRELGARGFKDGGAITAPSAQVVTVPVEYRRESHAPQSFNFYGQQAYADGMDYAEKRRQSIQGG